MNNQKEDIKRAAEVAQFRFGVIAPVVQYNYKTIEKWVSMYQRGGLEALMPHMYSVFKA